MMQDVETRCISPVSLLCTPSYSAGTPYPKISARLPDVKYISDRPIYRKTSVSIHSPTGHTSKYDIIVSARVSKKNPGNFEKNGAMFTYVPGIYTQEA